LTWTRNSGATTERRLASEAPSDQQGVSALQVRMKSSTAAIDLMKHRDAAGQYTRKRGIKGFDQETIKFSGRYI